MWTSACLVKPVKRLLIFNITYKPQIWLATDSMVHIAAKQSTNSTFPKLLK